MPDKASKPATKMVPRNAERSTGSVPIQESYAYGYPTDPYYVVLPPAPYSPYRRRRRCLGYGALAIIVLLILCAGVYFFWPSDPDIQVVRLRLNHISFKTKGKSGSFLPQLFMNISMGMTVRVWNKDYFEVDYDSIRMGIGYRGRPIGVVKSESGQLRYRSTAYVNATLDLDGIEVLHDVLYLLDDISRGELPLDTVTEFDGRIAVLFITLPLEESMSCEIVVDPDHQTIISQDCDVG
eukprot:Gb_29536 [translate_table: standard]